MCNSLRSTERDQCCICWLKSLATTLGFKQHGDSTNMGLSCVSWFLHCSSQHQAHRFMESVFLLLNQCLIIFIQIMLTFLFLFYSSTLPLTENLVGFHLVRQFHGLSFSDNLAQFTTFRCYLLSQRPLIGFYTQTKLFIPLSVVYLRTLVQSFIFQTYSIFLCYKLYLSNESDPISP